jgi:hypothetical protein
MSFIQKWNQVFFTSRFSVFDLLICAIIWPLASTMSIFWLLALIPAMFISGYMTVLVERTQGT